MDGILGVGIAEIVIIVLVILIIGGPENALKWSRDVGRMLRKAREMWGQLMAELEKDLGEDGKEIMKASQEFSQNISDLRQMTDPRRLTREAGKILDDTVKESDEKLKDAWQKGAESTKDDPQKRAKAPTSVDQTMKNLANDSAAGVEAPPENGRYHAWLPTSNDTSLDDSATKSDN